MPKACGNPKCCTSTGIHEGLTFGSGKLDDNGYWSKPCQACARAWDAQMPAEREKMVAELMSEVVPGTKENYTREQALVKLKSNHEWLFMKGWPLPPDKTFDV